MEDIMYRGVDDIRDEWTSANDGTMFILPINSNEIIHKELNE